MVLFDLCHQPSEKYAGISVGVSLGNGVFIDAVERNLMVEKFQKDY